MTGISQALQNVRAEQQARFEAQQLAAAAHRQWQFEQDSVRRGEIASSGLIIFPPFPPVLAASSKASDGPAYPEVLADCAGEPFFMAYGSLRLRNLIFSRRLNRIEDYLTGRDKLVKQLRDTLAQARDKSGSARLEALSRLAQAQERRLAALETEAEAIRVDLTTGTAPVSGTFPRTDANTDQPIDAGAALINAREKIKPGEQPGLKNYLTAILTAQFQPGLSLEQRLLLQEIAADSLMTAPAMPGSRDAAFHFFLPASARVRWPENTDAKLVRKLEMFQEKRSALKRDLAEAILGNPDESPAPKHMKNYADLAKAHAPRFAELEALAEDIRSALAGLPLPDEPASSHLPAELILRVGAMMDDKTSLLREVQRAGQELGRDLAPERVEVVYQNNTASLAALPAVDPAAKVKKDRKATLARLQARNDEFKRRFGELAVVMSAVRTEIQRYHDSLSGDKVPDVNALSIQLARAYTVQENWNRYRDYRDAVLTPGLSPAQRRLLFSAAVADLERFRLSLAN